MISFVGNFPPPVHGQSAATLRFRDALVDAGLRVQAIDTGEGSAGLGGKLRRLLRLTLSPFRMAWQPARLAYISVNAGAGIWVTIVQALACRLTGKQMVCHHHSSRYIREYDRRFALFAAVAGEDALHLANCDAMAEDLKARYPRIGRAMGYGNAGFVDPRLRALPGHGDSREITLGHMSNLTLSKGLGRTIDLLRLARREGLPVCLLIAGPCAEPEARKVLEDAQREFPDALTYLGPVYDTAKIEFFASTDIFVFPTRYANEAGPIVNLEALAAGAPVISSAQCCIASTLEGGGGVALDQALDFAPHALPFVRRFAGARREMSEAARRRFDELLAEQQQVEHRLIDLFRSAVTGEAVA